jgi:hypothetical protein
VEERGDKPRLLITGFYTEWERNELYRYGRYLRVVSTVFNEVTVVPNLTKEQRVRREEKQEPVKRMLWQKT